MSKTFWDKVAGLYDLAEFTNAKVNAAARKRVGELIPAGARVLDCAAGTGEFSLAAAKRAGSVLCTDLSLPMLDKARKKAKKQGISNIAFAQRDITALPDPDGAFDAVIAGNVLHLLDDPEPAVRELWRVTAPGGRLMDGVAVPGICIGAHNHLGRSRQDRCGSNKWQQVFLSKFHGKFI